MPKAPVQGPAWRRTHRRLRDSPKEVLEKKWAKEVLAKHDAGEGIEEDEAFSYYDFLNVMLGRKRFKVSLYMYDISDGLAERWSWLLLGHSFRGIWHTGVVVEWPEKSSEFWFGGRLFESEPGTTPFGKPLEIRPLGYTHKLRQEAWSHVAQVLSEEFTKANYDVLTHNCNHFSDKLMLFLRNDHIPEEVRSQPEMVMSTVTARALRPALNQWLGGFDKQDGRATDGSGEEARLLWEAVLPGALISFSQVEGGRPIVGEVRNRGQQACLVCSFDLGGALVARRAPRSLLVEVLRPPPPRYPEEDLPEAERLALDSAELPPPPGASTRSFLEACGWPF